MSAPGSGNPSKDKSRWRLASVVALVGIGLFSISDVRELTGLAIGDEESAIGGGCGGPMDMGDEQFDSSGPGKRHQGLAEEIPKPPSCWQN